MKWHHCIDSAQKLALELCRFSMNTDDGYGNGSSALRRGYGNSENFGCGYELTCKGESSGRLVDAGDGDGDGYGDGGDGWQHRNEW